MKDLRPSVFHGTSSTGSFSTQGCRPRGSHVLRTALGFFCLALAMGHAASSITISPGSVSLQSGQAQQFIANVQGGNTKGLTWSVNNIQGGNSSVGTISANGAYYAPAVASETTVTVSVNSPSINKSASATVTVTPTVLISLTPTSATVAPSKSQQLNATVIGTTNTSVSWSVSQGVGTISNSGLYTAPSMVPSSQTVAVTATSMANNTKKATANLTVTSSVSVAVSPLSTTIGAGASQQFTAAVSGTNNTAVTWSINPPVGVITSTGLYVAPSTITSQQTIIVTAVSASDPTKSAGANVTVTPGSTVSISMTPTTSTLSASQTQQFAASVSGTTNTAVTWTVSPPVGSISSSGLYTAPSSITAQQLVAVTATSTVDATKTASAPITLTPPALSITTTSLPAGVVNTPYNATLAAAGGTSPYTWTLSAGGLPPAIALAMTTGALSGTPTATGTYNMTVQVSDTAGHVATAALVVLISAAVCTTNCSSLTVTTSSLPNGSVGASYSATLAATGGVPPYTWSVPSGVLPPGVTLANSGALSGMPTSGGSYSFTIGVTDSASPTNTASTTLALTVVAIDSYGGRTDLPCTGGPKSRFYTERIGSRMWLCTPAGNAMWGQGMYVAGPQGDFTTKYGSASNAYEQTLTRLKSWGFNFLHTYTDANELPWNRATKMPAMWIVRPGNYGMYASSRPNNPFPAGTLDQNIKDLGNGISPYFTNVSPNGMPDWGDLNRLNTGLSYLLTNTQAIDPLGLASAIQGNKDLDYLIGVAVEDSDQTWGYFGSSQNDPFATQPSGMGSAHGGYLTAIMSPQQEADVRRQSLYTTDQTVYVKKAWHDFLVARYSTISDLNTAWGSTYTTFDSTATTVTGESLATTDGTAYSFSKTLTGVGVIAPDTIRVYMDGTMIAGDCFHPNWGDACNPTKGTTSGAIWGPAASGGTINYSSKAITVAFTSVYQYVDHITCTTTGTPSCTMSTADYADIPAVVGDHITANSSVCCNLTNETITAKSADVGGYYTYTTTNNAGISGSELWSAGARVLIAKLQAPSSGHVLTLSYQVNGWNSGGTGVMDEDGRTQHSWMGTDPYSLTNANSNTAADLRAFLNQLSHNYFSSMRTGVRAAFTNAGLAPVMYLGPDSFGTWTSTPRREVLQAASGVIDLAIMGGAAGYTLTPSMVDFMAQWYGGPFLDGVFLHANQNSPYVSNALPNDYATQTARGAAYQSMVQSYLSTTTSSGFNPRLGFGWWQYGDNSGEGTNWGLVTLKDNAYDGNETVTTQVTCSAPLAAYKCGGEAGNYGDVITSVKGANLLWRSQ